MPRQRAVPVKGLNVKLQWADKERAEIAARDSFISTTAWVSQAVAELLRTPTEIWMVAEDGTRNAAVLFVELPTRLVDSIARVINSRKSADVARVVTMAVNRRLYLQAV